MISTRAVRKLMKKKADVAVRHFSTPFSESLYGHGDFLHPTYLPRPGAGKSKSVALIPGTGIGQLLIDSVEEIFNHCDVRLNFEKFVDIKVNDKFAINQVKKCDAVLRGPVNETYETKEDIFLP